MKLFSALRSWSRASKNLLTIAAFVAVSVSSVLAYGIYTNTTDASSCPSNDIMPCGASTATQFIKKLKANNPSDMNNIYANYRYDLPKSQYDEFEKYAKLGKINPDTGNVTVNGVTVMYNALSIGRNSKGSISDAIKIDGKTYYQTPIRLLTKYTNDALVLFDSKGNVQTVIMKICGNPMSGKEKNPTYSCDALKTTQVDRDTFNFSSKVSTDNGASLVKVVYDFGDGTTQTEASASTVVEHTYANAGTYNAKVTAYVKTRFGRETFPITVTADCKKTLTVTEQPNPSVDIEKMVDGVKEKEVALNTNFTYNLEVTNSGNVDLTNVVVTDPAPANVKFISTDKGSIVNNSLSYTIPSLAKGASVIINITAQLTKYVEGSIENKACVDAPAVPGSPDDCDTANITTPKPKVPGVTIDKVVNGKESAEVALNQEFTYTLTVTNTGELDLANVVVSDPAPAGVLFLSTDKGSIVNNALSYTIPSLAINDSVTINIKAKATVYSSTAIKNTACVDTPTVPGNPDDCDDAHITVPEPKVDIQKLVNGKKSTQVAVGEEFTYGLKITNTGAVTLVNAAVTDPAPANIQFLSTDRGSIVNNALSYTIPSLGVGQSVTVNIKAKALAYVENVIVNTACVDTPTVPGGPDDCDSANVTLPKPKVPHVSINKVVNGKESISTTINTPFTYTVSVKNDGEVNLVDADITDPAPAGIQFLSTDKGSIVNNALSYTIPSLAVGETVVINISAKAIVYSATAIVNTACVDTPTVPGGPDDCDAATVTVPEPNKVEVCDATTGTIITVPEADKDKYEPVDSEKCQKIQVCVIADGTGAMVTITKDQFDSSKYSTNSADCKTMTVCRLSDKTYPVTIKESEFDSSKYSTNADDCSTPVVIPSTGPAEILGGLMGTSALGYGAYTYAASKRALHSARK